MITSYDVAVVGATGVVGDCIISLLAERDFPVGTLYPLASERSVGKTLVFRNKSYKVLNLETFDFSKVKFAFFSAGSAVSEKFAKVAAEAGCTVVDNTSFFRLNEEIPLVVPEINPHVLNQFDFAKGGIIANPNCSTIQMLLALKPIQDEGKLLRIEVSTYQAVSGAGASAIEVLAAETSALLNGRAIEENSVFSEQIAFNVIPRIGTIGHNGFTDEEMKIVNETHKIFENPHILINPTCVRVPVFFGHSLSVHVETEFKISVHEAARLLQNMPGVRVYDETIETQKVYPTAIDDNVDRDLVFVGRIRDSLSCDCGLNFWVVSDNIRKGAALNSIQIAELILKEHQISSIL